MKKILIGIGLVILIVITGRAFWVYQQVKNDKVEGMPDTVLPTLYTSNSDQPQGVYPVLDMKTIKNGDTFGNLTVSNSEVALYPDGSPKSVFISFTGNMIVSGTVGVNDMTGAIVLSATKEGGMQIPKFKGESGSGFCLVGDTSKIGASFGVSKKVTVEVKNYTLNIQGKDGCSSHAEFVRIITPE